MILPPRFIRAHLWECRTTGAYFAMPASERMPAIEAFKLKATIFELSFDELKKALDRVN